MTASTLKQQNIKKEFENSGISIKEWAIERGYKPRTVYAVLAGQLKCHRGISHKIAIELGLKSNTKVKFHLNTGCNGELD